MPVSGPEGPAGSRNPPLPILPNLAEFRRFIPAADPEIWQTRKDARAMRRLIGVLIGIAIGAGTVFAAFQYHLVRTDKDFVIVRKLHSDWHDAYVDIRGWTFRDWGTHRELSDNLVAAGHGDLVARSVADQLFRGLLDSWRDRPSTKRTPATTGKE